MSAPGECSTHKRRFGSARAAAERLAAILDGPETGRSYAPVGYRSCRVCGGYHLTSKISKPTGKGKARRNPTTRGRTR